MTKNEQIVTWGQAVRALLISVPLFIVFLTVLAIIVLGIVVLAGFTGQGGHGGNPSNTEFFDSAFGYASLFGIITFLSSLAVLRGICLCIGAMCRATYGTTHVAFFIVAGVLAIALLLMMIFFA